jgi:hypothetical protein
MLFAISNIDKPDSAELRKATREAHVAYLSQIAAKIYMAGPTLDAQGNPLGSLVIVEAADEAEAKALAAADPYATAGLFASSTVSGYRAVFEKFAKVGA